ncbi:MAG TPA: universal stress protein [Archangium sp.]|nr:universal stress protein [Archangium sp.]
MGRILIAVDGSTPSHHALDFGVDLAARLGVGATLLYVMPQVVFPLAGTPDSLDALQDAVREECTRLLEGLAARARGHGVSVTTELALGVPADVIHERAEAADVQLAVMGSRGHGGVTRLLLGSVATRVVHLCTRPVAVVMSEAGGSTMQRILVAVDGTPVAREAARVGLDLANRMRMRVTLVHVLPALGESGADFAAFERACEIYASELLEEVRQETGLQGPPTDTEILHGEPAEAIAQAAEAADVHMVILGTRARGALARTLLGSVTDALLPRSPKPVMVVPESPKRVRATPEAEHGHAEDRPCPS